MDESDNISDKQFDIVQNDDEKDLVQIKLFEEEKSEKKSGCKFPTAYTILMLFQFIIFLLSYIIPQGLFDKLIYQDNKFIINYSNGTSSLPFNATKEALEELDIKINISSFINGHITKPISIPNTYKRIDGELMNFFELFLFPMLGLVDSASISFLLMILGGNLNLLVEMNALSSGMSALARLLKGKEFILLILCFLLVSLGGTTFGMCEEILAFYPILMPVFLKNGLDGILGTASLFFGSTIGFMFSTFNAFNVVIGSYASGVDFSEGLIFRIISFIIGDIITVGYFYYYYRKIKKDEKNSLTYEIKEKLIKKFEKKKSDEENQLINNKSEKEEEEKFTLIQKMSLLIFLSAFIIFIIGITCWDWWFEEIGATFIVTGIIYMFISCKGEEKAMKIFIQGAGDFVGVALSVGLARGINLTLEKGNISDTILNTLSGSLGNLNKIIFSLVMLFIFMILGFVINSSTGLAILAMPVFAPLADSVGVKRSLVINAYMFAQNFVGLFSPTGLILIVLEITGVPFNLYFKFVWPFLLIILGLLIILMIINSYL